MNVSLIPLINRALELYRCQGLLPVVNERDAADFMARTGNGKEQIKIIAGPHCLYAKCSRGYTDPIPIADGEGPDEVRALGEIAKIILLHEIRKQDLMA